MKRMDIIHEPGTGDGISPSPLQLLDPTISKRKEGSQAGIVLCRRATSGLLTAWSLRLDPLWEGVAEALKPRLEGGRVRENESRTGPALSLAH